MLLYKDELRLNQNSIINTHCDHCGEIIEENYKSGDKNFCCQGCQTVYKILSDNNLGHFYQLKEEQLLKPLKSYQGSSYNFLIEEKFIKEQAKYQSGEYELKFYLDNVTCAACIWVIEKLPEIINEVTESQMNFSTSVLKLKVLRPLGFKKAAEFLDSIGYKPHLVDSKESLLEKHRVGLRSMLKKVAIAGMAMGNIMLLAISVYAGAQGIWSEGFGYISGALFLPVLIYAALPFYQDLLNSIKLKRFSLDALVAIAIILGAGASYYSLFSKSDHYYFDSLSALVFLLLASRYYLKKVQLKVLGYSGRPLKLTNVDYLVNGQNKCKIHQLKAQDNLIVKDGQVIPCDGVLKSEEAYVNRSFLTGESEPVKVNFKDSLYSGELAFGDLKMTILKNFDDSYLASLLNDRESNWFDHSEILFTSQKYLSRLFWTVTFFSLALITYFAYLGQYEIAFNRVLALLIITCPCSLGLGVPLVLTLALKKLSEKGILIKNANSLNKLMKIKNIFFDKTGTLTSGKYSLLKWEGDQSLNIKQALYSLELKSRHPIARSIINQFKSNHKELGCEVANFQEIPGQGVSGIINDELWKVRRSNLKISGNNIIDVLKNNVVRATLYFSDEPFEESFGLVRSLNDLKKNIFMLTGDTKENANYIAEKLGIKRIYAEQLPEDKENIVKKHSNTLMIGDGVNDIKSMLAADLSISVKPEIDLTIDSSDITLLDKGARSLTSLFKSTFYVQKIIDRIIYFSIIYNVIGITLSIFGFMDPLLAAVLMPLSVVLIISFSLVKIRLMEKLIWK